MIHVIAVALALFAAILALLSFNVKVKEGVTNAEHPVYSLAPTAATRSHPGRPPGDSSEALLKSAPALAWSTHKGVKSAAARVTGRVSQTRGIAGDSEVPWQGLVILPDLSVVTADLEFAATQASVSLQESTWRCDAYSTTVVEGVTYEVFGLFQLLYDPSMRRLTESMGYAKADLLRCAPNAEVAMVWKNLTDKGAEWRLWVAKPQYRADGTSGDY